MKRLAAILIFFIVLMPVFAEPEVFSHPADLSDPGFIAFCDSFQNASLSADFTQIRRLERLGIELESSGRVIISENVGMAWLTETPYESVMIVTDSAVKQKLANGTVSEMDVSGNIIYTAIADAIQNVFSGDFRSASEEFSVFFTGSDNSWEIGLIPSDQAVSAFISYITIKGEGTVFNEVAMVQSDGNSVIYEFRNMEAWEERDEEAALFSI